ncbi:hypothetical protein AJ80_10099 [Polytolypa hystricis UAMH7299]|uniref:Transcription factor domain-containing protein n=1 Tax=Polytolypa hystricis (strain UAMH7299) TaxID=1447883 RepID=A0A2B7WE91_POLH7|nr:hypothetical protein AJ80_10099 [Polytolypa hystricis UAMH7299]
MWVREYRTANTEGDGLSRAIILLTLALGAISASSLPNDEPPPGYGYFMKACAVMDHSALCPSLQAVRCRFLKTLYFLYTMQPLLASNAIADASNMAWLMWRYQAWKSEGDDGFDACLRIFWSCSVLEEEIAIHIRRHTTGIYQDLNLEKHIPDVANESPSGFFLAETQLRLLMARLLADLFKRQRWTEKPIITNELKLQLEEFHKILPSSISFPTSNAEELFGEQKCYLRMQYHCFSIAAGWPTILTMLEDSDKESSRKLEHSSQYVLIKEFFAALILLLKTAPEQLWRRGPLTWVICEV